MALFAPTVVKLSHGLYEHQEQLCQEISSLHVHEVELDCEFQKFQLSPQHHLAFVNIQEIPSLFSKEKNDNHYTFLSQYQKLPFALRGPPSAS